MKEYVLKTPAGQGSRIDYARELNEQQREVVLAGDGPILVIAGAGSGKTRTLTYRVARLLESGVPPSQILLLTFTNKAAREMLRRVETLVSPLERRVVGGTFHHVGHLVLRRAAPLVGYASNFTILDREDARDLLDDLAGQVRAVDEYRRFPKGDVLLEILSYARNASLPVERVIAEKHPAFAEIQDLIVQTCKRYAARKRELNLMDFDDLLAFWHEAICRSEEELELERRQWRYILVDEYQDTNLLQSEIVERIAGEAGNLMVVGDDSQSIYSFRGARFENILEFPKRHPSARVFKLEVNYRSTPEILALANSSIRQNRRQFEKTLRAVRPSGVLPEVVAAGDAGEQARFVAQQVLALHDEGLELREIAVLYRAQYQSMELQMELTRLRIPFVVRSGLRFFEQAHVKDVAAYLKIVANPRDELAWKRVLKHVPKVGKATAEKVWRLLERDAEAEVPERLPKAARRGWESLRGLLERLRGLRKAPAEMIRAVLDGGYEAYLESAYANAAARMDDLRRLADFALRYADVEGFLAELALSSGVAGQDALDVEDAADAVVLSTVHQAKGLEWRAVFVLWAADGKFPDARALKEGGEEEERRLFYVAATRAKDRLAFVYPVLADERFMMGVVQRPSRFLKELDPGTYEKATVTSTPF